MLSAMTLFAWSPVSAFPGRQGGPGSHGDRHATIADRFAGLDLDVQTREAVFAILDDSRPAARALRDDVRAAHEKMTGLLDQDQPDEGAVLAQVEIVGARMTALKKQHLSTMLAVRALLSPEQIAKLRATQPDPGKPGCTQR
jgi:Spy/CpxP family protein refolding chaperone